MTYETQRTARPRRGDAGGVGLSEHEATVGETGEEELEEGVKEKERTRCSHSRRVSG